MKNALDNPWAKAIGIGIGIAATIFTGGVLGAGLAIGLSVGGLAAFLGTLAFGAWDNATGRYNGDYVDSALGSNGTAVIDNIWNAQQTAALLAGVLLAVPGAISHSIYYGVFNGKVIYIGRSSNLRARFYFWKNRGIFDGPVSPIDELSNLTYSQARKIEDYLIRTTRGGPAFIRDRFVGGKLWNNRHEISDKHSYWQSGYDWAGEYVGNRWNWPNHLL